MSEVLRLAGVSREYRSAAATVVAVDAVDLTADAGEMIGVVGPSGSGKTTLLNLILGWERPTSGVVRSSLSGGSWRSIAVVPQELGLLPELTAIENVELPGRLAAIGAADLPSVFGGLGLDGLEGRYPDELSMGEQQRVAVARAVMAEPRLLVADEPTAHQDEQHADRVMERLVEVARGGGVVLVATHDERLLDHVDRVVQLLDGRLVD